MKQQRTLVLFSGILVLSLILCLFGGDIVMAKEASPVKSVDGKLAIEHAGSAVTDGKYIYYSYQGDGKRMDLIKLDPKTFKSKSLAKQTGNGYTNLTLKGNYIYSVLDKVFGYGTGYEEPYIYKISKDGKTKKMLAVGKEPIIMGNRIYYFSGKVVNIKEGALKFKDFKSDGYISSMDLNGKNKKKVTKVNAEYNGLLKLYKSGDVIYYMTDRDKIYNLKGKEVDKSMFVNSGEIQYDFFEFDHTYNLKTKLKYRKAEKFPDGYIEVGSYKNGKWTYKKIVKNSQTINFTVLGNYMMIKEIANVTGEKALVRVYLLDKNGKRLKMLATWPPAE